MPGLVGIVDNYNINTCLFNRMRASIKHEDFQKIDTYINSKFGIGRVHLGITDSKTQPVFNAKKNLCIYLCSVFLLQVLFCLSMALIITGKYPIWKIMIFANAKMRNYCLIFVLSDLYHFRVLP